MPVLCNVGRPSGCDMHMFEALGIGNDAAGQCLSLQSVRSGRGRDGWDESTWALAIVSANARANGVVITLALRAVRFFIGSVGFLNLRCIGNAQTSSLTLISAVVSVSLFSLEGPSIPTNVPV